MIKTMYDVHHINDDGKLDLLRSIIEELTPQRVEKLLLSVAKIDTTDDGEPFAVICDADSKTGKSRTIWSDINFVTTTTVVDYETE